MLIETERLIIRDFEENDASDLFEILGDPETMKFCEPAYDFAKTEDFLQNFCIGRKGAVAAVLKESKKLIGYILFNEYEKDVFELGWFFNRDYWQKGFAYESCKAVIGYAFSVMNIRKIFAETIDREKSVPLMEKLGMVFESREADYSADNEGNIHDFYVYSIENQNF